MSVIKGAGTRLALYLQAAWGTAEATDAAARPFRVRPGISISETIEEVQGEEFSDSSVGFVSDTYNGLIECSGDASLSVMYESMGRIWEAALGASDTTADTPSPGLNSHVYEPADSLPILTGVMQVGGSYEETFQGLKINTLTLTVNSGRRVQLDLNFLGEQSNGRATTGLKSYTLPTKSFVLAKHLGAAVTWNSQAFCIQGLTLTVENRLEGVNCIEKDTIDEPEQGDAARLVTVACTARFENQVLYTAWKAETVADLDIDFSNDAAAAALRELKIHLDDCKVTEYTENIDRNGSLTVSWTWTMQLIGSDKGITITAVNAQANATETTGSATSA